MARVVKHYRHEKPWLRRCAFCYELFDIHIKGSMRLSKRVFLRGSWVETYICVDCIERYSLDKLWQTLIHDPLFDPAGFAEFGLTEKHI